MLAIEPEPNNYRLLCKNIEKNGYQNVSCVQKAISNSSGKLNLFFCEENRGDHRIFNSNDNRDSIEIESKSLDELACDFEKIDIIKMDIQGAEYLALEGMEKIIHQNNNLIMICEFAPYLLVKCGTTPEKLLRKLTGLNFKLNYIDEYNKRIAPTTKNELLKLCSGGKYLNLYLTK